MARGQYYNLTGVILETEAMKYLMYVIINAEFKAKQFSRI